MDRITLATVNPAEARRRALWNEKCLCHGRYTDCHCIDACEDCGHVRVDHAQDEHYYGSCDIDGCTCRGFVEED